MAAATPMPATVSAEKAGFWIRFVAIFIDAIILAVVATIIGAILNLSTNSRSGIQVILGLLYYVYFWSNTGPWPGQTLGSKILNIRVVRTNGSNLTITQAFIRYVGFIISAIPLFIGLIWAAFDANKQGWHDKIAGTYVVKVS